MILYIIFAIAGYLMVGVLTGLFTLTSEIQKERKYSDMEFLFVWPLIVFKFISDFVRNFDINRYR